MGLQSPTKNGEHMVKLKILRGYTGAEGKVQAGAIVQLDAKRAREILAKPGRAVIAIEQPPAPTPAEQPAKKSSRGTATGRRSRTPKSKESGKATPSSASQADPASPESNASTPGAYGAAGMTFTS